MNPNSLEVFEFSSFRLDSAGVVLYNNGEMVRGVEKYSLQVLAVILAADGHVATYDEIIRQVWSETEFGVHARRVNEHVSKLRSLFETLEPGTEFFENLRGRGYRFGVPIRKVSRVSLNRTLSEIDQKSNGFPRTLLKSRILLMFSIVCILIFVGASAWISFKDTDQDLIMRGVKESQMYESLVLYRYPERFSETDLDRYWAPDLDMTANFDRTRIRQSVQKLVNEKRRHGDETKCDLFEFQTLEVDRNRSVALARTLEKWSISEYSTDGTLLKLKTVGPYFVDYNLRYVDGKWLIEKSTTARTVRPMPRLDFIELSTEPVAGKQFFVNLSGTDFEPVTALIEVVGTGCPDTKPCRVDNGALLEHSSLSKTKLERVPLTLKSGRYSLRARNGDSQPSNLVYFEVP